jgi:predicted cupin superfamily sugar epimerase
VAIGSAEFPLCRVEIAPTELNSFSLVSCMVSPGFDFRDFVLFEENELISMYPNHAEIIKKLNGNIV